MQQHIEAPTPQALADLVARCDQINRYTTQLVAAEETRVAALASGIVAMRQVLELRPVPPDKLPVRQARIPHWALTSEHFDEVTPPSIRSLDGLLVIDEHEQVKILSNRSWRGAWRQVTLWRDGIHAVSAAELLRYLVALTLIAQRNAPNVARSLLERSQAIAGSADAVIGSP